MNGSKLKSFLRGFYVTLLALSMLVSVALGASLAQENTEKIGYGESCLPEQSDCSAAFPIAE